MADATSREFGRDFRDADWWWNFFKKQWWLDFLKEFVEGITIVTMMFFISGKVEQLDKNGLRKTLGQILTMSLVLALLNSLLAVLDQESHLKIKEGMKASVGGTMLAVMARR